VTGIIAVGVALASMATAWLGARGGARATEPDPAEAVEVTAFTMPFRELDVASEIGGVLTAVRVEEGDEVREGDALAEFRADVLQAKVAVSEGRIKLAQVQMTAEQAAYEMLKQEYERAAKLFEQKVMSDQQYHKAKLEMDLAALRVESAKAQEKVAELAAALDRAELARTVVRAPISGQVFRILKRPGEAVEAQGPILKMVSVDPLYVIAYAPISTSGKVRVGMKAPVMLENMPERPLRATVAVVDKVADAASGTYRVKLTLPNPDRTITAGAKGTLRFDLPR